MFKKGANRDKNGDDASEGMTADVLTQAVT